MCFGYAALTTVSENQIVPLVISILMPLPIWWIATRLHLRTVAGVNAARQRSVEARLTSTHEAEPKWGLHQKQWVGLDTEGGKLPFLPTDSSPVRNDAYRSD